MPFKVVVHPLVRHTVLKDRPNPAELDFLVRACEKDGKSVPTLLKQYERVGANFVCTGVDASFKNTPGLLLEVDLNRTPGKYFHRFGLHLK